MSFLKEEGRGVTTFLLIATWLSEKCISPSSRYVSVIISYIFFSFRLDMKLFANWISISNFADNATAKPRQQAENIFKKKLYCYLLNPFYCYSPPIKSYD